MIIDEAKFIIISMDKEYVILEIKNKSLKLLVGYIFDNKIKVIYRKKAQLSVPLFYVLHIHEDKLPRLHPQAKQL